MLEEIKIFDSSAEFFISEGCHIVELSNSSNDENVSIARARIEPGVVTRWHRLTGITERYVVLEGEGIVEVGELSPKKVVTGDVVIIPPLSPQRIFNTGDNDLVFLAICSPRFKAEAYEDIDDVRL